MSLTSYLGGKTPSEIEFQTIIRQLIPSKNGFTTLSGRAPFSSDYEALVPCHLIDSYDSALVGMAFDYLARMSVGRINSQNKEGAIDDLCASRGLELLKIKIGYWRCRKYRKLYKVHLSRLKEALFCRKPDDIAIFTAAIYLARLEMIFRSGKYPEDTSLLKSIPPRYIVNDLASLFYLFEERFINGQIVKPTSTVVFNPDFGRIVPMIIGGADADIFIDGTLYDFKTTKNFGYRWKDAAQIVGYYLLYLAAIALNEPYVPLTRFVLDSVALYKARFGEIERVSILDLGKENVKNSLISILRLWDLQVDYEFDYQFDHLFAWYEAHS
jgi:hypothetical protein